MKCVGNDNIEIAVKYCGHVNSINITHSCSNVNVANVSPKFYLQLNPNIFGTKWCKPNRSPFHQLLKTPGARTPGEREKKKNYSGELDNIKSQGGFVRKTWCLLLGFTYWSQILKLIFQPHIVVLEHLKSLFIKNTVFLFKH